jgi:DNA-binding SARP family transcriptional activator
VIEFRVLGPLEVVRQGRVLDIGAGKKRALLAVLLLHANEVVTTDRLIDEVWGESAPVTAPKIVQGYISQLRKTLAGEVASADGSPGGEILLTRPRGYVLQLDDQQLDADRFEALLVKARAALADGAAHEASLLLREALGLWRGPPLADLAFEAFAQDEVARLDELRSTALEERIDADLALGRHAELVAELEALVAREPLRERPRGQLMLALYRCGRQAEALQVYAEGRRVLVGALGIEPSRTLQDLEQAILRQDLSLDVVVERRVATDQPAAGLRPGSVFVGRERELGALLGGLDDALAGRGRLLLVGGEPGIGKSRLAEELASRAKEHGAEVHWGRCWEAGGAPPYWPWAQALRSCIRERSPEQLRGELGSGAAEIADLVPDVRGRLQDLGLPPELSDPKQARFRLFDAIAGFLERASGSRPLVLVLDDLNSADGESLLLLQYVARELADAHLLLVGTYRDVDVSRRHPLSQTLGELAGERLFERVPLRGLSHEDVERFVEVTCGFAPDPSLVTAIHANTEGNPFFVSEIVQLLLSEGGLRDGALGTSASLSGRIPEGVREAIGRRLDRLSPKCNETLTIAAALGREFTLAQVARLTSGLTDERLLDVLEEALTAHVVEEPPGAPGRYQFTHTLIQATLLDELSLTRRAQLHARIAVALEDLYGARADAHVAELAHHFAEAETVLGPEKLVRYSLLAGEAALAAYAPEQAVVHFERALAAKGDEGMDDDAAVYFGLGRAQLATLPSHDLEPAIANLTRAFEHYIGAGDVDRAVAVAAHPLPLSLRFGYDDAAELIERGLGLVSRDSHEEGRMLAQRVWFAGFIEGDYEGAQVALEGALSIAEREHDAPLERRALAHAAFVEAFHFHWEECIVKGSRAVELARAAADPSTEISARRVVAIAMTAIGDHEHAHPHTASSLALAQQLRETWWLTSTSFSHQVGCLYAGDWEGARQMNELGLATASNDPRHLALRALLEYELGEEDEGAIYLARLQQLAENVPPPGPIGDHVFLAITIPLVARISGNCERLELAQRLADGVLALPRLAPALATYARSALALTAVLRDDAHESERLYRDFDWQPGTASFFVPLAVDRLLGLLCSACGQTDAALAHFDDALSFCARAGYRPEYAWAAADCAEALAARAGPGDEARGTDLHDQALGLAQELGMRALLDRMLASREAVND